MLITGVTILVCVVFLYSLNFLPLWFYSRIDTFSSETGPYYRKKVSMHLNMDASIPDGSIIFVGDSITQGLSVFAVTDRGVNFGISFDTTVGVLKRIDRYEILHRAGAIVIAIGINDIPRRENSEIIDNYRKIAGELPCDVPVYFSSILPVDEKVTKRHLNSRVKELNVALKSICSGYGNISFVDTGVGLKDIPSGSLKSEYHKGDGLHLNEMGYKQWITSLRVFFKNCD